MNLEDREPDALTGPQAGQGLGIAIMGG